MKSFFATSLLLSFLCAPLVASAYTVQTTTSTSDVGASWGYDDGGTRLINVAQSFKTVGAGTITAIVAIAGQVGSPADHTFITIEGDTTSGCSTLLGHCPTGTPLGTSSNADITTAYPGQQSASYTVSAAASVATNYWVVAHRTGSNNSTNYYVGDAGQTSPCPDSSTELIRKSLTTWTSPAGTAWCWNITVTITPAAASVASFANFFWFWD